MDPKAFEDIKFEGGNEEDDISATHIERVDLEPKHADFLLAKHGTIDLEPLPPPDPTHPLNRSRWRKNVFLVIFAVHGAMAGFLPSALIPAVPLMAEMYGVTVASTTYLISVPILIYGPAPYFWLPLMERFGRLPCLMVSLLGATAANIGSIFCSTYGQQMACRCIGAWFIAPPCALGSIVVTELFFRHERGSKTGIWKLLWTMGIPGGAFIFGFVIEGTGLRWLFIIETLITFGIFLAYLVFGFETKVRPGPRQENSFKSLIYGRRFGHQAWSLKKIGEPFKVCSNFRIMLTAVAYAVLFAYANIAIAITEPQAAGEKFHLGPAGIGLQFIAMIIGLIIGEIMGGLGSDRWMKWMRMRRGNKQVNEDRLWLAYPGFILSAVGLIVWGVAIQNATPGHWIVSPCIGAAISFAGCQLVTTVLVTYAIDTSPASAAYTGLIINLIRQIWGFVGPFYYPIMFKKLGYGATGGIMAAVAAAFPTLCMVFVHCHGRANKREGSI